MATKLTGLERLVRKRIKERKERERQRDTSDFVPVPIPPDDDARRKIRRAFGFKDKKKR